jgi:dolichyl-phosphate beta-glucosyltransferase
MSQPATFSVIVPVYNEAQRFGERAPELARFVRGLPSGSELLIVDDGSTDRTRALVRAFLDAEPGMPGRLLARPHEGKGAAVRAGLLAASGGYAGFCDVDLSTPLADLLRLFDVAREGPVLAIGSRDLPGSRVLKAQHPVREGLGKTYNRLVRRVLTPGVHDTQCGAKAAAASVWADVLAWSREPGFAWDVEVVALARRRGFGVREVPVSWVNDPRTRVRLGRDGAAMVAAVPRILRTVRAAPPAPARMPEPMAGPGAGAGVAAEAAVGRSSASLSSSEPV